MCNTQLITPWAVRGRSAPILLYHRPRRIVKRKMKKNCTNLPSQNRGFLCNFFFILGLTIGRGDGILCIEVKQRITNEIENNLKKTSKKVLTNSQPHDIINT